MHPSLSNHHLFALCHDQKKEEEEEEEGKMTGFLADSEGTVGCCLMMKLSRARSASSRGRI